MLFWKKKKVEDLPVKMLIPNPNFNETVEIYQKYSDNMKRHLMVALIKATPSNILNKVKPAFDKHALINS